jgi:hypothetical protein
MDFIKAIMGDIEPPAMDLKYKFVTQGESKYPID